MKDQTNLNRRKWLKLGFGLATGSVTTGLALQSPKVADLEVCALSSH